MAAVNYVHPSFRNRLATDILATVLETSLDEIQNRREATT